MKVREKFMGFFKRSSPIDEGYQLLVQDLKKTTADLESVYSNLEQMVEPDLIDYYIYEAKAVQMKYRFLLNCIKKVEQTQLK